MRLCSCEYGFVLRRQDAGVQGYAKFSRVLETVNAWQLILLEETSLRFNTIFKKATTRSLANYLIRMQKWISIHLPPSRISYAKQYTSSGEHKRAIKREPATVEAQLSSMAQFLRIVGLAQSADSVLWAYLARYLKGYKKGLGGAVSPIAKVCDSKIWILFYMRARFKELPLYR